MPVLDVLRAAVRGIVLGLPLKHEDTPALSLEARPDLSACTTHEDVVMALLRYSAEPDVVAEALCELIAYYLADWPHADSVAAIVARVAEAQGGAFREIIREFARRLSQTASSNMQLIQLCANVSGAEVSKHSTTHSIDGWSLVLSCADQAIDGGIELVHLHRLATSLTGTPSALAAMTTADQLTWCMYNHLYPDVTGIISVVLQADGAELPEDARQNHLTPLARSLLFNTITHSSCAILDCAVASIIGGDDVALTDPLRYLNSKRADAPAPIQVFLQLEMQPHAARICTQHELLRLIEQTSAHRLRSRLAMGVAVLAQFYIQRRALLTPGSKADKEHLIEVESLVQLLQSKGLSDAEDVHLSVAYVSCGQFRLFDAAAASAISHRIERAYPALARTPQWATLLEHTSRE